MKIFWSQHTARLCKTRTNDFRCKLESVSNFHTSGNQICEKWLKEHKDRPLSYEDIALSRTIRLMDKIAATIEQHSGWLGAFITTEPTSV